MNPGPVEEGGKIVSGVVDALKANPAILALTLINFLLLGNLIYSGVSSASERLVFATQLTKTLANCVPLDEVGKLIQQIKPQ